MGPAKMLDQLLLYIHLLVVVPIGLLLIRLPVPLVGLLLRLVNLLEWAALDHIPYSGQIDDRPFTQ